MKKTWRLDIIARRISSWTTNMSFLFLAEKDEEFSLLLKENLFKQIKHLNTFTTRNSLEKLDKVYEKSVSSIKKFKILRGLILDGICFEGRAKKIFKKLSFT